MRSRSRLLAVLVCSVGEDAQSQANKLHDRIQSID